MDKEIVVHIDNEILLSYKKEHIWVSSVRWMNLEPIMQSEVSQKEKDMWNVQRWYQWSHMQGRKEDTNVKNRLLGSVGEGKGGTI